MRALFYQPQAMGNRRIGIAAQTIAGKGIIGQIDDAHDQRVAQVKPVFTALKRLGHQPATRTKPPPEDKVKSIRQTPPLPAILRPHRHHQHVAQAQERSAAWVHEVTYRP